MTLRFHLYFESQIHFGLNISQASVDDEHALRFSHSPTRNVPNLILGRASGAENIAIYVFFPHLEASPGVSTLSTRQLTRWTDEIFHPAIYKHYPAHYTQHLPAGYQHALANSRANQVEARKTQSSGYQSQQAISQFLSPHHLHSVWKDVQDTISRTPGLYDFRDAQVYVSAKGTKLQFKPAQTASDLLGAIENFCEYAEQNLNMEHARLDQFYVDIGKEICAPEGSLAGNGCESEPQIYSWKRCCLENHIKNLYNGEPPAAGGQGQRYYEQNMLYQACSLTSETPKRSVLREGGLVYSQFYGSVKELSDASNCKPFDNDGLEDLALDPHVRRGIHAAVRGHLRELAVIERAYKASKQRADTALSNSLHKSFGIREEHRINWLLFQELRAQTHLRHGDAVDNTLLTCPSYAWAVTSEVYLGFSPSKCG